MLKRRHWIAISQTLALVLFAAAFLARAFPLGVSGEWVWPRLTVSPSFFDLALAAAGIGVYVSFVTFGFRLLKDGASRIREVVCVTGLLAAAIVVQVVVQTGAPEAYGLTKWVTLGMPGSNGYFEVAKREMA